MPTIILYINLMKKKRTVSKGSGLVTKGYLDKRFEIYDKKMDQRFQIFGIRMDIKFDDFGRKILDQVRLIRDEIQTSNDRVAKELDDIRTNYQVFEGISEQTRDIVGNHESRIKKLENPATS